jgi:hypothetical protein
MNGRPKEHSGLQKVQSKTAESFSGFTGNRLGKYKFPFIGCSEMRIEAFWKI